MEVGGGSGGLLKDGDGDGSGGFAEGWGWGKGEEVRFCLVGYSGFWVFDVFVSFSFSLFLFLSFFSVAAGVFLGLSATSFSFLFFFFLRAVRLSLFHRAVATRFVFFFEHGDY